MTDVAILRDTLEIAIADEQFAVRFYDRLLFEHPELAPMFTRNSRGAQQKMFAQKLTAIVDAIAEPKALHEETTSIARTHREYGATPQMYEWVGATLLTTLRESMPEQWTAEAERAWTEAYATLASMILGR